jgi:ectoine hydroxylase-related dioxygenase (phytanoyl-CoA dioxygenase family)
MADMMNTQQKDISLAVHGVYERHKNEGETDVCIEEIRRNGFAILKGVLSAEEVAYTRTSLDEIYNQQVDEFGLENLKFLKDRYIARSMLVYDDFYLHRIACNEKILAVIKKMLGNNISLSSQVGILSPPNDVLYQTAWHRELQYQHFTISRPLAIQSLMVIDRFDAQTGGTFFIPGSHLHEMFPSDEYARKHEIQIVAEPGDAVVFDALTYHRAGVNTSPGVRRAINNLYTLPIIQQQINLSRMMNGRFRDDPFLAGLLGYRWETADSVLEWRQRHLEMKKG